MCRHTYSQSEAYMQSRRADVDDPTETTAGHSCMPERAHRGARHVSQRSTALALATHVVHPSRWGGVLRKQEAPARRTVSLVLLAVGAAM